MLMFCYRTNWGSLVFYLYPDTWFCVMQYAGLRKSCAVSNVCLNFFLLFSVLFLYRIKKSSEQYHKYSIKVWHISRTILSCWGCLLDLTIPPAENWTRWATRASALWFSQGFRQLHFGNGQLGQTMSSLGQFSRDSDRKKKRWLLSRAKHWE